jgi:hypothetical protein
MGYTCGKAAGIAVTAISCDAADSRVWEFHCLMKYNNRLVLAESLLDKLKRLYTRADNPLRPACHVDSAICSACHAGSTICSACHADSAMSSACHTESAISSACHADIAICLAHHAESVICSACHGDSVIFQPVMQTVPFLFILS